MTREKEFRSIFLYVCIGILIPIIAALIPFGYKIYFPEYDLNFSLVNKANVKTFKVLQLQIANNGEKLEKQVEVIIKKDVFAQFSESLDRLPPLVDISPETKYKLSENNNSYILNIGNMRPGEKINLSVLSENISMYEYGEPSIISVRSEENTARLNSSSDLLEDIYPFTFWSFVLLITFGVVGGIYQEYFEGKEKREARLLKEIDKIKK